MALSFLGVFVRIPVPYREGLVFKAKHCRVRVDNRERVLSGNVSKYSAPSRPCVASPLSISMSLKDGSAEK